MSASPVGGGSRRVHIQPKFATKEEANGYILRQGVLFQHAIEYAKKFAWDELSFTPFTWMVVKDPEINKAILE